MTDIPLKMDPFEKPDPILTSKIVTQLKSQGIFDEFRRECMADVDTKPAYQNLRQRVEGSVAAFLKLNPWRPDMNKNQLRDNLRKHIQSGGFLDIGVDRIVDQVVNPKIYTVFLPKVEELVQNCMGMDKGKPVFEPPPPVQPKPEPPKFQNKHNLAPRATLTAPRFPLYPTIKAMKLPEPAEEKLSTGESSPTAERPADRRLVMDEEIDEAEEADDDEESPAFEPHCESDRLILGVRTDSSDSNSNENQVVTTIVDDNLEERIDKNEDEKENNFVEITVKEEEEKDGFTSDDSLPKTPTINMEESDGTLIEFNSISEYKRYQNKFDEESLDNVEEEVMSSQWIDESGYVVKGERSSNEEDSGDITKKRKINYQNFDEKSSSSFDKSSSCDEGKSNSFTSFTPKKLKLEDDNESLNELMMNDDSNTDKSLDTIYIKQTYSISEHRGKSKSSSSSSKEEKSHHHHHHHSYGDRQKKSSSHHRHSSKTKHTQKEHRENLIPGDHSSREKSHDHSVRDDKETSKDRSKEKVKGESSSSKHHSRENKSKSSDRDKGNGTVKKLVDKSDLDDKFESDLRHEHGDGSRDYHYKEKKLYDRQDKHSDLKRDHDHSHKHSSDKRHGSKSSKHRHSSSKHGHKSSSEKHRSDKGDKPIDSSDKHRSHEKKSEKDSKHESKKKQKEYCRSSEKDFEGRRSSDRDSNGPSGRGHFSSNTISKSSTSRNNVETSIYSSDKTTSNSDNTVSDNIDSVHVESSKLESVIEQGIASPDPEIYEEQCNESKSVSDVSKELSDEDILESDEQSSLVKQHENNVSSSIEKNKDYNTNDDTNNGCILLDEIKQSESTIYVNVVDNDGNNIKKCDTFQKLKESDSNDYTIDVQDIRTPASSVHDTSSEKCDTFQNLNESVSDDYTIDVQDIITPASSVHDTSSEKENIDFAVNYKKSENISSDLSPNTDDKIVKFKKPKIAANIFEVRKIMQERRHLKRMEKKRLKLLMKTNTQDCPIESSSEEEKSENQDVFLGFEDFSKNKIEAYDCLISRLNNEISMMNDFKVNPNLVTSLIDVNPDLDEYIETVLHGKVHRHFRVRVPPICDDFYKYDAEQKAYILIKTPGELVDNNLNNLNPLLASKDVYSNRPFNENIPNIFDQSCSKSRLDISEESDSENQNVILQASSESDSSKSPTHVINNNAFDNSREDIGNTNNSEKPSLITADEIATLGIETSNENCTKAPKQLAFSLTFNQTYDEILKDREQNAESLSDKSEDNCRNRESTVVKITNDKVTEQVIMKRLEINFLNKSQVPKITRTESTINGKLIQSSSNEQKQIPLISRINKSNNVVLAPSSSVKSRHVNGIDSLESSSFEAEVAVPGNISPKTINDMIGIVDSDIDQRSPGGVTCFRQRTTRNGKHEGAKQHQRYNSSDLYKPRPQLGTRRSRGQSSKEVVKPAPAVITRKRAAGTSEVVAITPKRRR